MKVQSNVIGINPISKTVVTVVVNDDEQGLNPRFTLEMGKVESAYNTQREPNNSLAGRLTELSALGEKPEKSTCAGNQKNLVNAMLNGYIITRDRLSERRVFPATD